MLPFVSETFDKQQANTIFWSPQGQFVVLAGLRRWASAVSSRGAALQAACRVLSGHAGALTPCECSMDWSLCSVLGMLLNLGQDQAD